MTTSVSATSQGLMRRAFLRMFMIPTSSGYAGSGPWQGLDDRAPFLAFGYPFLPLAEELDDHLALGIIGFEGCDMAVDGRLAHGPGLGDVILAQVQVEGRVHDVD